MRDSATAAVRPARRTEGIRYAVRDVVALAEEVARGGKPITWLNVGDPNLFDFAPPPHVVEAVHRAMLDNRNGYAPSSGIPEAIEAVRAEAGRAGITNIQHVFITSGASEAIDLTLTALCDPGDNVLTPAPGYPLYTAVLAKLGVENRPYYLDESRGWQPDPDEIAARIDARTRAIVLINPNNPTGGVCERGTVARIAELAARRGLVLLSDEIYDKLLFPGATHTTAAALRGDGCVVTFNGLSKSYLVPGFRIGWGIVSGPAAMVRDFCDAIRKLERARLSANHPEQYAIRPALEGSQEHLRDVTARLARRGEIVCRALAGVPGLSCTPARAAFYAFPKIDLGVDDGPFCERVLRETGVVLVPGSGFGQRGGSQHFRVVFLPPEPQLQRAMEAVAAVARSCSSAPAGPRVLHAGAPQ